jgi:glycosyltransferase involved in cell wall biosynthesis
MDGYKITALICTKNEANNLIHVLPKIPSWVTEVLLIDAHSSDKTVEVARELCPQIKVLMQPNKGKGDALRYGIGQAAGDIVVTLDADGTTEPDDMRKFIVPLIEGYDYVKGSRFLSSLPKKKPFYRIIGNWIITLTFDVLFLRTYTDLCSGYNAFWKEAIERAHIWSDDGFADEPLINCRVRKANLKVIEIGCVDNGRISGETNAPPWRQGFGAIKTIIRERFHS